MAGKGVPPAAGVVAEVALEGLLPGVQLDMSQKVPFLGEGGPTLIALEGSLAWDEERRTVRTKLKTLRGDKGQLRRRKLFPTGAR